MPRSGARLPDARQRHAARACESALAKAGVRAFVVGSLAYGGVRPESDLDLLIVSYPGKTWGEVSSVAAEAARPYGVPVDVIFADTLPPAVKRAMLKDARRAHRGGRHPMPTSGSYGSRAPSASSARRRR